MSVYPPNVNMIPAGSAGGGGGGAWTVQSKTISTPPGSPGLQQSWIVGPSGTDAWSGHDNEIATWDGESWIFTAPGVGDLAYVVDEFSYWGWNGSFWFPASCCPISAEATYSDGDYHAIASIPMPDGEVWLVKVNAVCRRTDSAGRGGFICEGVFYREGGGVVREGTVNTRLTRRSDGRYNVTLEPSGNNIEVLVRGASGQVLNWSVDYAAVEEVQ